jgi:ABC-type transport system involved in cytochrome c biogenesis ATPase subunit
MNPSIAAVLQVRHLRFAYPGLPIVDDWSQDSSPASAAARAQRRRQVHPAQADGRRAGAGRGRAARRGIDARADPLGYRRQVYWCGPELLPFEHLTALEYFSFIGGLYAQRGPEAWACHIEGFGLQPHLHKPLLALSTGTQRKVALTAGLSVRTAAVLLDEPLAALDAASIRHFATALAGHATAGDAARIMTSHEELPPPLSVHATIDFTPIR